MLLQWSSVPPLRTLEHHHRIPFSSALSYSVAVKYVFRISNLSRRNPADHRSSLTCSISQVHSYGTVDYERRPSLKWREIYRSISMMEKPELGAASVLNQWENEGRNLTKWELCRVVKELRKFKRYNLALEVYEWMNNREERFRLSTSDIAIQIDLIAKVRGISTAEDYFSGLPNTSKDKRVYGAVLNAYVRARLRGKAESLMDDMRHKGYVQHPLPFNVMMTLYMSLKKYDKVDSMVSEMTEKSIPLDIYSYNIWLSSCGSQKSAEKMEQVFERMKTDININPNWTTFSTMATMYIKLGLFEKAEDCLKKVEGRIIGRDRIPYHYLISLYGNLGKKEDVYRIWNTYKSNFPKIPNLGFHAVISSLVRLGDIKGAERIYEEWLSVKFAYDPRIANLLIGYYVKEGFLDKADEFFQRMIVEGKPNSSTWEILAEGYIGEKRISDALACFNEAVMAEGSKHWRPKPVNVSALLGLCEEEGDFKSKEALVGLLREKGCAEDEAYMYSVRRCNENHKRVMENGTLDYDQNDHEDNEVLFDQLQGSL